MKSRLIILWLWLAAVAVRLPAQTGAPSDGPPPPVRHIFIIDTSTALKGELEGIRRTVGSLLFSGFDGRMHTDDLFEIWSFNDKVNGSLVPVQRWSGEMRNTIARDNYQILASLHFEKKARMDRLIEAIQVATQRVDTVVFFLITAGEEVLVGSPVDRKINVTYGLHFEDLLSTKRPFLTTLVVKEGRFVAWAVNPADAKVELNMIEEPKPLADADFGPKKPVPAATVAVPVAEPPKVTTPPPATATPKPTPAPPVAKSESPSPPPTTKPATETPPTAVATPAPRPIPETKAVKVESPAPIIAAIIPAPAPQVSAAPAVTVESPKPAAPPPSRPVETPPVAVPAAVQTYQSTAPVATAEPIASAPPSSVIQPVKNEPPATPVEKPVVLSEPPAAPTITAKSEPPPSPAANPTPVVATRAKEPTPTVATAAADPSRSPLLIISVALLLVGGWIGVTLYRRSRPTEPSLISRTMRDKSD